LSVLASFFAFLIRRDTDASEGVWVGRTNPVPCQPDAEAVVHRMVGRDAPVRRERAELRRRQPRRLPREVDPDVAELLIREAGSWRDRAILLLLARTGQRVGDSHPEHGRHGVLGMRLDDLDRRGSAIRVRLKGARDEHRVPVTADFWPVFDHYLADERGDPPAGAVWVGHRRGAEKPLRYSAFEAALRYASHTRALSRAQDIGEPARQIAARQLEIDRIRSALHRAEELPTDVAVAIEAAAS
jgi:integrase